jgi:IS1 family transposase
MTMISREPRQILGFEVGSSVSASSIQKIVDRNVVAENYFTDGSPSYLGVDFVGGKHIANSLNKKDAHIVESINADLRHYIAGLRRRSRCFFRSVETLRAVLSIFVSAYNKFGEAKLNYRNRYPHRKSRDYRFSIIDFW